MQVPWEVGNISQPLNSTAKKVSLSFFLNQHSFSKFNCFYFFGQHKVILWVIMIMYMRFLFSLFQTSDSKTTLCFRFNNSCSSLKWKKSIIVCFACFVDTLIRLRCYIDLINLFYFINNFLEQNHSCFFSIT